MTSGETPIREPAELTGRVAAWPGGRPLALDTEFVRERTYYPRLCLIQAAAAGDVALVDALAIPDGGALAPLLDGPGAAKLLHAARQDIEALLPLTGVPLAPVFDTQQAAALLGFPAQVGYADLVRQLLGIELAKGHARTDWARRPLSAEQLAYAADDVRYLPALAAALEERLDAAGRRGWLDEESAALTTSSLYRVEPDAGVAPAEGSRTHGRRGACARRAASPSGANGARWRATCRAAGSCRTPRSTNSPWHDRRRARRWRASSRAAGHRRARGAGAAGCDRAISRRRRGARGRRSRKARPGAAAAAEGAAGCGSRRSRPNSASSPRCWRRAANSRRLPAASATCRRSRLAQGSRRRATAGGAVAEALKRECPPFARVAAKEAT